MVKFPGSFESLIAAATDREDLDFGSPLLLGSMREWPTSFRRAQRAPENMGLRGNAALPL